MKPSRKSRRSPAKSLAALPSAQRPPFGLAQASLVLLLVLGVGRVVATYSVFNDTYDENNHITCGLEYWERGEYFVEPQHPPLGRLVLAAPAYLFGGLRLGPNNFLWTGGEWQTGPLDQYWTTLSWARAGNLVFLFALLLVVYRWTLRLWNRRSAIVAVLVCLCSPTLLAHSAVACLDLAVAAMTTLAVWRLWRWFDSQPSEGPRNCLLAGCACGLAVTTKFSAVGFVALASAGLLAWAVARGGIRFDRRRITECACAMVALTMTVWAVYRFDFGRVAYDGVAYKSAWEENGSPLAASLAERLGPVALPAPALFRGVIDALNHNAQGHRAFLMGEWSSEGRAYYFPVALATKTTLPLLLLGAGALVFGLRRPDRRAGLMPPVILLAATLAVGVAADINIGVRHILPVYPGLAIMAASLFRDVEFSIGALRHSALAAAAACLLLWHCVESIVAHPDYLAYFNQSVRGNPEQYLADSNLDWGQDLARLAEWMRENRVPNAMLWYFGQTPAERFGIQVGTPPPASQGWLAISINNLSGMWGDTPQLAALRDRPPDARVGRSIYLYRMTAEQAARTLAR